MPSALPTPDACCPTCPDPEVVNVPGTPGNNGTNGSVWRAGEGIPSNSLGVSGDFYLSTTTGVIYTKTGATYGVVTDLSGHNVNVYDQTPEPTGALTGDIWISPTDVQIRKADLSWQSIKGPAGSAGSTPLTTKGDILGYSTLAARVGIGSNGKVLTANSTQALGLEWDSVDLTGVNTSLSGSLPVANGGTAGTTAATARAGIGAAASGLATASGLTSSATDKLIGRSSVGSGAVEEIICTTFVRTLLDDTTAAAARTTLGVVCGDYLLYQHQKTLGTDGGTFTNAAWRTVPITTEVSDTNNNGTLAANVMTLATGTYRFRGWMNGYSVDGFQCRLYNIDTTSVIAYGRCSVTSGASTGVSLIEGVFTIGSPTQIRLEAQCTTTEATDGFGKALSFGTEIYASIEFFKIA